MMTQRFNGRYRVTLFYKGQTLMVLQNESVNYNIDFDANIVKDGLTHGGSRGNVYIYNLAQTKINTLEKLVSLGLSGDMHLSIEFSQNMNQDQYQLMSYDDVTGIFNELGETDYKTNFILKSGQGSVVKTFSCDTYQPGTLLSTVVANEGQKMVDGNSIQSCQIGGISDYTYSGGVSVTGNTFNYLKNLANSTGNTVFIDKSVIYFSSSGIISNLPPKTSDLNFSNGLLEPPHIGQVNFNKKYMKHNSSVSFQFKALLMPSLNINDVISVLGEFYTVKRITHSIETRSGVGYSIIEGFKNGSV